MASVTLKMRSNALQQRVEVTLYFPTDLPVETGLNTPKGVLYLLHGYTNCGSDWLSMTAAGRYAADNSLILVMPDMHNSFYADMVYGGNYYTYITEELPAFLHSMMRLPTGRENTFVAGLSMGGYGALLLGLSRPDLYSAAASFSGAVDVQYMLDIANQYPQAEAACADMFDAIYGQHVTVPPQYNLLALAQKAAQLPKQQQPRIMCTVGLQDHEPYFIYEQNQNFKATMEKLPLAYHYMEWEGRHEWNFWDRSLCEAIDYFLDNGYAAQKRQDWAYKAQTHRQV
ncbi:MAG: alpha/beta hydrolase-fold protein [Oscillospiraceae bacterium]|nr:alpha/beta hydrolase-fold protein [Oscillospiraceae bacterium]